VTTPATPLQIDACLPQTQCARCGYPRCIDYANAVSSGEASIDRCPPGGDETIAALAALTAKPVIPLSAEVAAHSPPLLARILEADCIGCTLCIQACPVDAIIGASKLMHTVIASECTACELCVPACPMDCIELYPDQRPVAPASPWRRFDPERVGVARQRSQLQVRRRQSLQQNDLQRGVLSDSEREEMRDEIRAAVQRVKAKRLNRNKTSARVDIPVTEK